jgi:multiple sugar transport system permease protein
MSWRTKKIGTSTLIHIFLIVGSLMMLLPFAWMVLTAFKTRSESISVNPFYIFPTNGWHFENFVEVWNSYNFLVLYKNTLIMIALRVLCACLTATLGGYAFGRLKFPFKNFFFALILVQMMVPGQIFIIPQYLIVSRLHMMNTQFALVLPGAVTAFGTYLCKQGYQSLPASLEEAAELDGANVGQRFLYVMLPLTRSSLVSLGIFTALFAYKDLMWPMIVCPKTNATTLTAALSRLQGQFTSNYPQLMAGAVMAVVPMLVLYLIFQKQFVEGIASSGGKL